MECSCGDKGKYKCPKCTQRYCSAKCCEFHKAACMPAEIIPKFLPIVKHPPRNFLIEEEDETILNDDELAQMSIT